MSLAEFPVLGTAVPTEKHTRSGYLSSTLPPGGIPLGFTRPTQGLSHRTKAVMKRHTRAKTKTKAVRKRRAPTLDQTPVGVPRPTPRAPTPPLANNRFAALVNSSRQEDVPAVAATYAAPVVPAPVDTVAMAARREDAEKDARHEARFAALVERNQRKAARTAARMAKRLARSTEFKTKAARKAARTAATAAREVARETKWLARVDEIKAAPPVRTPHWLLCPTMRRSVSA